MKKNAFIIVLYLVVLASFATVCFLAFYYVPVYKELFRDIGMYFPLIFQYTVNISNSFGTNVTAVAACGFLGISVVWWIPSRAIKTVCFALLLLINVFLGVFLYGGTKLTILNCGCPNSVFVYVDQRSRGQDTTMAYAEMVRDAKSPEFIDQLQNAPLVFLGRGVYAAVEANNEKVVALINTSLSSYLWEPEKRNQVFWKPAKTNPELDFYSREFFLISVYGLYKINGKYPEDVSKKLEVYDQSERLILLARFMCHDGSVLRDLLKYYPVDFVHNFATWSPEAIEEDAQLQVDFKDISSHDILKYIRQGVIISRD